MAKTNTTLTRGQANGSPKAASSTVLLSTVALLVILGLASYTSQIALRPFFGRVLASESYSTLGFWVLIIFTTLPIPKKLPASPLSLFASALFLAPLGVHFGTSWAARSAGPHTGPVYGQALVAVPILAFGGMALKALMGRIPLLKGIPAFLRSSIVTSVAIPAVGAIDVVASKYFPAGIRPRTVFNILGVFTTLVNFILSLPTGRALKTLLPLPLIILSLLKVPADGIKVLAQVQSVTGLLTVTDSLKSEYPLRIMRCDAGMIGGRFLMPIEGRDGSSIGHTLGDSIYASFVLHQAGLLVEGLDGNRALILGLGAGVSAKAYIESGFETTIVELDPAVYQLARDHFALPTPAAVAIEDARGWVEKRVKAAEESVNQESYRYDVIVHDLFTGGGVPSNLFTLEFWLQLRKILNENGIVIINYVGYQRSPALVALLRTLLGVFGTCEAYHDGMLEHPPFVPASKEYIADLVIICTHSAGSFEFREPTKEDYHGSALAENVFDTIKERHIDLDFILGKFGMSMESSGWALRGAMDGGESVIQDGRKENILKSLATSMAGDYWLGMRKFVPAGVWEAYD